MTMERHCDLVEGIRFLSSQIAMPTPIWKAIGGGWSESRCSGRIRQKFHDEIAQIAVPLIPGVRELVEIRNHIRSIRQTVQSIEWRFRLLEDHIRDELHKLPRVLGCALFLSYSPAEIRCAVLFSKP